MKTKKMKLAIVTACAAAAITFGCQGGPTPICVDRNGVVMNDLYCTDQHYNPFGFYSWYYYSGNAYPSGGFYPGYRVPMNMGRVAVPSYSGGYDYTTPSRSAIVTRGGFGDSAVGHGGGFGE